MATLERWGERTWQRVGDVEVTVADGEVAEDTARIPELEPGAYRLVRTLPDGTPVAGPFWVPEPGVLPDVATGGPSAPVEAEPGGRQENSEDPHAEDEPRATDSADCVLGGSSGGEPVAVAELGELERLEACTDGVGVTGVLLAADDGPVRLCEAVGESLPPQCLGASIEVRGLDPGRVAELDGQPAELVGLVRNGGLEVFPSAAPPAPVPGPSTLAPALVASAPEGATAQTEPYTSCWSEGGGGMCADGFPGPPEEMPILELRLGEAVELRFDPDLGPIDLSARLQPIEGDTEILLPLRPGPPATLEDVPPGDWVLGVSGRWSQGDGHYALRLRVS